jgi:hypothetical protein
MLNKQSGSAQEQVAQLEYAQQTALGILGAFEQLREICPGYDLDIASGEYERVGRQFAQASQQLIEAKGKAVGNPASRAVVPRLIKALLSL